jgi:hypothetical protein
LKEAAGGYWLPDLQEKWHSAYVDPEKIQYQPITERKLHYLEALHILADRHKSMQDHISIKPQN